MIKVLGISGSLRSDSHNSLLLQTASRALPADAEMEIFTGLRDLPHYDQDEDVDVPAAAVAHLRDAIASADVVLFATPEYNGTIPGVLKNAVDWASRPVRKPALRGKPVAVIGASTGQFGGAWAQADLRKSLGIAGSRVVDEEFAVAKAHEIREASDGSILDDAGLIRVGEILEALVEEGRINQTLAAKRELDAAA